MSAKAITGWLMFGVTVVLIAWDVVATLNKESGDTISEELLKVGHDHLMIPLMLGIIAGHVFWPQAEAYRQFNPFTPWMALAIGLMIGHLFWTQYR